MPSDVLISDAYHVARKSHHCDLCHAAIKPGERYNRQRSVWDGEIGVWRAHTECRDAAKDRHSNNDWRYDEPWSLEDWDSEDEKDWLRTEHPVVARRLGMLKETDNDR